ncbi:MAG: lysoplasmalogenase [Defluviitaleaceae bacterium]|nr:lysoplasmalogenase [Defluviitaleaceae bacterium]
MENDILKFILIIICLAIATTNRKHAIGGRDFVLLFLALTATLAADFFLVILRWYPVGVAVFCLAHICYTLRFGGNRTWKLLPLALPAPIILYIIFGDILVAAAAGYLGLFIISYSTMIYAIRKKKYPAINNILIFAGMTLFVLCDICVAIYNFYMMGIISNHALANLAIDAVWLFYAPSQIALALSGTKFIKQKIAAAS